MNKNPSSPSVAAVTQAAAPSGERPVYEAPAILWEQPFVALAQTSECTIPGESELCP